MQFFYQAGIVAFPLMILSLVILFLIVRAVVILAKSSEDPRLESGLLALLFWGFTAAVLGFLGQCSGLYKALTVISQATEISPKLVVAGFAESFTTTIWGGTLLLISGAAWFLLGMWRRMAKTEATS